MSAKNLTLLSKLLIALIPTIVLAFILLSAVMYFQVNTIEKTTYKKEMLSMKGGVAKDFKTKLESLNIIVTSIANNSVVVDNMYNEERDMIFKEIFNLRQSLSQSNSFKDPLIQITDMMNSSYVKSWDKKAYGANVGMRESIKYVNKNLTTYIGAEVTRGGIMLVMLTL